MPQYAGASMGLTSGWGAFFVKQIIDRLM